MRSAAPSLPLCAENRFRPVGRDLQVVEGGPAVLIGGIGKIHPKVSQVALYLFQGKLEGLAIHLSHEFPFREIEENFQMNDFVNRVSHYISLNERIIKETNHSGRTKNQLRRSPPIEKECQ